MSSNLQIKRRHVDDEDKIYPLKQPKMAFYLDDHTPVRTIKVTNVEYGSSVSSISAEYLRGYFEHAAGRVSDIKIVDPQIEDNQMISVAYVTFVLPEDAAKLICNENCQVDFKFTIEEASWAHQPIIDPETLQFEEVNDDCLLHIASFLDLIDVVNLGKTSTRLQSFAKQIFRTKTHFSFDQSDCDPSVSMENLPIILRAMGSFVKSIYWKDLDEIHLQYLAKYCPNVRKLNILYPSLDVNSVYIKTFFKNITSLVIVRANFYDNTMKKIIQSSANLKHLQLINCRNIRGTFLSNAKQLVNLKIINCRHLRNILHSYEIARIPKLKALSVDRIEIDCDTIKMLVSHKNLKRLTLRNVDNTMGGQMYSNIQLHLPELRSLTMKMQNMATKSDFQIICEMVSSLANLKCFGHSSMSWELLDMIRRARELRKQPTIEILISKLLFNHPKKIDFVAAYNDTVKLSLNDCRV